MYVSRLFYTFCNLLFVSPNQEKIYLILYSYMSTDLDLMLWDTMVIQFKLQYHEQKIETWSVTFSISHFLKKGVDEVWGWKFIILKALFWRTCSLLTKKIQSTPYVKFADLVYIVYQLL